MNTGEKTGAEGKAEARGRPRLTLVVLFLLYMLNYMDRNVMSAVAEPMKRDLALTDAQLGGLQTAFLLCVAGCAVPAAHLLDRRSRKGGVGAMAVIWSAATALTAFMGSFPALLLARALVGVGEAGFSSGGTAMLSTAYPASRRAKVLGVFNASIPVGAALGTVLGGVLVERTGSWSTPFLVFAVPGLVLAALTRLLPDDPAASRGDRPSLLASLGALVRIPTLRATYLAFAMNVFVSSALLAWLPPYLARTYGLDPASAAKKAGLVFVLALVGAPLGGFVADRWARSRPDGRALSCALTSLLAAVALAGALALGRDGFPLLIAHGVLTVAYLAPGGAITQDVAPPSARATAWGACVLSMYLFGGAYSPLVVGALSDRTGDLRTAMLVVPLAGVLATILFWVASRTYAADREKARVAEEEGAGAAR